MSPWSPREATHRCRAILRAILRRRAWCALAVPGAALSLVFAPTTITEHPPGTAGHGRDVYQAAGCAMCHAASLREDERSDTIQAGHPLEGAPWRGTWWNGRITTDAGEAADFCMRTFLDPNSEGLSAPERKGLVLFMQGLGSERGVSPLVLLRRDSGDVDLRSGDPARGRDLYRRACGGCHGTEPRLARALIKELSPAQIADVIRKGSGTMPFFQVDRLPSPQVADIAVYLESVRDSR